MRCFFFYKLIGVFLVSCLSFFFDHTCVQVYHLVKIFVSPEKKNTQFRLMHFILCFFLSILLLQCPPSKQLVFFNVKYLGCMTQNHTLTRTRAKQSLFFF